MGKITQRPHGALPKTNGAGRLQDQAVANGVALHLSCCDALLGIVVTARFVTAPRKAAKRPAGVRVTDTAEILPSPALTDALEQSDRCTDCGVPFCQAACPLQNNIPDWLRLASQGRLREAWNLAAATSTMPEICGRICPQDRLCEGACTLEQAGFESVTLSLIHIPSPRD